MVLTSIIIVISVWPRSIYNLPATIQLNILEDKLVENKILLDWEIIPLETNTSIDQNTQNQISDIVGYLCDYHRCDTMNDLFPSISYEEDSYQVKTNITNLMNINYVYSYEQSDKEFNISWMDITQSLPLDVSSYSSIIAIQNYTRYQTLSGTYAQIDVESLTLHIMNNDIKTSSFDITDIIANLLTLNRNSYDQKLEFDLWSSWNKLIVSYAGFQLWTANDITTIYPDTFYINGYLLVK